MTPPIRAEHRDPGGDADRAAQELADRALAARSRSKALELAQMALARDPECTDAQIVLLQEESLLPKECTSRLKAILNRAETRLGASILLEHRGSLWEVARARPCLRARMALALAQEKAGKPRLAIRHLETLLALDAQDHLGARFRLVCCLLAIRDPRALATPLKHWEDEDALFMAWAALLERIHAKDERGAEQALVRARQGNPHVEDYLTGRCKRPKRVPDTVLPGSPGEALACLLHFGETWASDREGMYWLFRHP